MTDKEKLDKVLDYVTKEEDRYYDISGKAFDKGNMSGQLLHMAEATAFQRVRYFIEMMEEENA